MPNTKTGRTVCKREWAKVVKALDKALVATKAADEAVDHSTELFQKAIPPFVVQLVGTIDFAKSIQGEI